MKLGDNKIAQKIKDNKITFAFIFAIIVFSAFYFSASYGDVFITANHGIRFWDILFQGKIRYFYKLNYEAPLKCGAYQLNTYATYDFLIHFIFALWNFPLWLIGKLAHISALDSFFGALWAKAISLPFLAFSCLMMYKISSFIEAKNEKGKLLMCLLFLTSIYTISYIVVLGEYDIITMAFLLAGLYFYLKDKHYLFLLMSALAVPVKAFSLLMFVALLLYKEKNILKIFANLFMVLIPTIIFRIVIPIYKVSNIGNLSSLLFSNTLPIGYGATLFVLLFVLLCIWCYISPKFEPGVESSKKAIYISFISFGAFLFSCPAFPYWFMYVAPFIYLIFFCNQNLLNINAILETVFSFSIVLNQILYFQHCFSSTICFNTVTSHFIRRDPAGTQTYLSTILERFLGAEFMNSYYNSILQSLMALSLAALFIFCYINYPRKNQKSYCVMPKFSVYTIFIIRFLLAVFICTVPIMCYIYSPA